MRKVGVMFFLFCLKQQGKKLNHFDPRLGVVLPLLNYEQLIRMKKGQIEMLNGEGENTSISCSFHFEFCKLLVSR